MMKVFKKTLAVVSASIVIFTIFAILPNIVGAENVEYVPLSPLPDGSGGVMNNTNITTYLIGIFKLLIGVAGALAVVMIVVGGIQYMSTDAIYGKKDGKEKINRALGGLLLALTSWLILNTINPKLLEIKALIPKTNLSQQATTPVNTQTFKAKIIVNPLSGPIAQETFCIGSYSSLESCNANLGATVQMNYPVTQYEIVGTYCTTGCVAAQTLNSGEWVVYISKYENGPATQLCLGNFPTQAECNAAKPGIVQEQGGTTQQGGPVTVNNCVQKSMCPPSNGSGQ
ncbi:MAG: hypothetical protein U0522_01025 [Candidatus Paceibacterota bacterium]